MKIKEISVKKLFGYLNYRIEVRENITIIHGPNGSGKTTILKMLDCFFSIDRNENIQKLMQIEFESIALVFENDVKLYVTRKAFQSSEKGMPGFMYPVFTIERKDSEAEIYDAFAALDKEEFSALVLRNGRTFPPYIEMTGENKWVDRRDGSLYDASEILNKYGGRYLRRYFELEEYVPMPVRALLKQVQIRYISSDRLTIHRIEKRNYSEDILKVEKKVSSIATDIAKRINAIIQQYAQTSQTMDRTFPYRAIRKTVPLLSIDEIKEKLEKLESKRKQLIDNGLIDEANEMNIHELLDEIKEDNILNLSLYAQDTEKKLNVFNQFSQYITLFRTLIDNNFNHKSIVFDKKDGFYFVTAHSKKRIKPEDLSSGEQQELVMFYELIFETTKDTLVLIDEPELSLHIKWQLDYIDELMSIINLTKCSCLIATHSPQIINHYWDWTVSLTSED